MKTIELSTGTLLVVSETPFMLEYNPVRDYSIINHFNGYKTDLPGCFQLLGHPSEITGEVWGKVCERFGVAGWKNYKFESQYEELLKETATQSAMSLLDAHNIKDTDVLLFKPKNKQP